MAYDPNAGYVLLYGGDIGPGSTCADSHPAQAWAFSGGSWSQLALTGTVPLGYSNEAIVYDAYDHYLIMEGGWDGCNPHPDTYRWWESNSSWQDLNINTADEPSQRSDQAYSYDPISQSVIIYGGDNNGVVDGDTWSFQSGVWNEVGTCGDSGAGQSACSSGPGLRTYAKMTFDSADDELILYGGCSTLYCSGGGNVWYGDTWSFAAGKWSLVTAAGPAASAWVNMVFDGTDDYTVLFGGQASGGAYDQTWLFGPPPSVSSFSCSPTSLDLSSTITCTVTSAGGIGAITASYTGTGCSPSPTAEKFTCSPSPAGTYDPTVTLTDSVGKTGQGTTSYTVNPDPAVTASSNRTATDVGLPVSFGATPTSGTGTGSLTFSWTFGDGGSSTAQDPTHSYSIMGTFVACVNDTDSTGVSSAVPGCVVTTVNGLPTISSFAASPATVTLPSGTTTLTVLASGGTGSLDYAYAGLPPGCTSANTPSLSCTPNTASGAQPYSIRVFANDTVGQSTSDVTTLGVNSGGSSPTLGSVSISPPSVNLGYNAVESFTATAFDTDDAPISSGVSFSWSLAPSDIGTLSTASGPSTSFTSGTTTGSGTLTVAATYGGNMKTYAATFTVSEAPAALVIVSFSASPASLTLGSSTTISVVTSGGTGTLSYSFTGLPVGCNAPSNSSSSFSCSPASSGTSTIMVTVTDQGGHTATSSLTLTVSAPSSQGSGEPYWEIAGVVLFVVALIVVVLFLFGSRRRRQRTPPAPPTSDETAPSTWAPDHGPDGASPEPDATTVPHGPSPASYSGVTFSQPPSQWATSPRSAYGTYSANPMPPPTVSEDFPSPKVAPGAYRPWALHVTEDGIEVEELGGTTRGKQVVDAEFTPVEEKKESSASEVLSPKPTSEDAYVVLYGLSQRPRSLDSIQQMVRVTDSTLHLLLQTLEQAHLIAHGVRGGSGQKVYVITPIGEWMVRRAIGATQQAAPNPSALPAGKPTQSSVRKSSYSRENEPGARPSQPAIEHVEVDGFRPEDVNPKAKSVPKGAYQAWSADVIGGSANIHEIGGEGAQREAEERERIRKLLEARARQKKGGGGVQ